MLDVLLVVLYYPLEFACPTLPSCLLGRLFSLICCLEPYNGDYESLERLLLLLAEMASLEEDWR